MRKPKVLLKCVANAYAGQNERIIEISGARGRGCLVSIRDMGADGLRLDVYRRDGVEVIVGAEKD